MGESCFSAALALVPLLLAAEGFLATFFFVDCSFLFDSSYFSGDQLGVTIAGFMFFWATALPFFFLLVLPLPFTFFACLLSLASRD
jgi:hypothetical protein